MRALFHLAALVLLVNAASAFVLAAIVFLLRLPEAIQHFKHRLALNRTQRLWIRSLL